MSTYGACSCNLVHVPALEDLLRFGVTAPKVRLRKAKENARHDSFTFNCPSGANEIIEQIDLAASMIVNALSSSVEEIVQSKSVNTFALSGGADSRLILALLKRNHPNFLNSLRIYSRVHPSLTKDTDRDSICVQLLTKTFKINVEFESPEFMPLAFLRPLRPEEKSISGLWGGELLGAEIFKYSPFRISEVLKIKAHSELKIYIQNQISENRRVSEIALYLNSLINSDVSAMYGNPTWLRPRQSIQRTSTPFLGFSFLKSLFQISPDLLKDYRLYQYIYAKHFPEFSKIPFNNEYLSQWDSTVMFDGIDAKSFPNTHYWEKKDPTPFHIQVHSYIKKNSDQKFSNYFEKIFTLL